MFYVSPMVTTHTHTLTNKKPVEGTQKKKRIKVYQYKKVNETQIKTQERKKGQNNYRENRDY